MRLVSLLVALEPLMLRRRISAPLSWRAGNRRPNKYHHEAPHINGKIDANAVPGLLYIK